MKDTVDFTLLMYAIKGKGFVAELLNKTKQEYYRQEVRVPAKVLMDYYKAHKGVPSYEILCDYINENASKYSNTDHAKKVLGDVYAADKTKLVDGDFSYLITKLKKQYNQAFLKGRIDILSTRLHEGGHDTDDLNDYLKKTFFEVNSLKANQIYAQGSLQETAKEYWIKYNETRENPDTAKGVFVGFRELDLITNGFRDSEVIVVSGPTGSGKSILLMQMGINAWLGGNKITMTPDQCDNSGKNVWFISIENPFGMMRRRIDSCVSGIGSNKLRDGLWTLEEDGPALKQAMNFQDKYNKQFYVSDLGRGVTVNMIEAEYERVLSMFSPDLIVIDYLGIMDANEPTGKDWLDQGTNARDVCEFARQINKPILSGSQMKAAIRSHSGVKRFAGDSESVARSKMITDNININLHIDIDDEDTYGEGINYDDSPYMKIILAKCRDSKKGSFVIGKEFWRQRVYDLDFTDPGSSAGNNDE
jgi:replicative DNA helicase